MNIRSKGQYFALTLSFFIISLSFIYAMRIARAVTVFAPTVFRFLISEEENLTVSVNTADINGGAAYLWTDNGKTSVVFDCYLSEEKAKTAKEFLEKKKIRAAIYDKEIDTLYLKTKEEKRQKKEVCVTLERVKNCIEVLDGLAKQAEAGDYTQERLKEGLNVVKTVLNGVARNNAVCFENITARCKDTAENITSICKDIVFAKDIRYCKVSLCDAYIQFCDQFSI